MQPRRIVEQLKAAVTRPTAVSKILQFSRIYRPHCACSVRNYIADHLDWPFLYVLF